MPQGYVPGDRLVDTSEYDTATPSAWRPEPMSRHGGADRTRTALRSTSYPPLDPPECRSRPA